MSAIRVAVRMQAMAYPFPHLVLVVCLVNDRSAGRRFELREAHADALFAAAK